jgi:Zn-dependent M16 (insulinase) family peptidase
MTKYIIGTMSGVDAPLTPSMKGERAAEYYIRNISYEDLQREREEILNAGKEDIKALSKLVGESMKQNRHCTLGNEAKIKQNKELFDTLVNVLE